jgi:hypothetical protein
MAATALMPRDVLWLYFAPCLAEIAVAEDGDYRRAAGDDPIAWFAVAKALARKESWQAALDGFNEVVNRTAKGEDLAWLRTNALQQRVEVLKRLGRLDEAGSDKN